MSYGYLFLAKSAFSPGWPASLSKMVCVLQTYMGKEFNVNGQTV